MLGEETPGDLFGEEPVVRLGRVVAETPEEGVDPSPGRVVDMDRAAESLVEGRPLQDIAQAYTSIYNHYTL